MESKYTINQTRATAALVINVALFFLSIILGLIIFDQRQIWVKVAFLVLGLVLVGLSFVAYRIFSGAYFIAIDNKNLILSKTIGKTIIPFSDIEKLDLVKGKGLFKGDDFLKIEYNAGQKMKQTTFLLFYIKDSGDKIYSDIIAKLEHA